MYTALAILSSIIGLFVTGAALYTAWYVLQERKGKLSNQAESDGETSSNKINPLASGPFILNLHRWMVWDWAVAVLFGTGAVFLFTDLLAVGREKGQYEYPPYHYGYLLCGFIFCVLGMLFAFVRIVTLLWLKSGRSPLGTDHAHEPQHTHNSENRI